MKKTLALVFVCLLFAPFLVGAEDGVKEQYVKKMLTTPQFSRGKTTMNSAIVSFLEQNQDEIPINQIVFVTGYADQKISKKLAADKAKEIQIKTAFKRRDPIIAWFQKFRRDIKVAVDDNIQPRVSIYRENLTADARFVRIFWFEKKDNTALLVKNMQEQVVKTNAAQSKFLESIAEEVKSLKTAKAYNPQPGQQKILAGINSVSLNQSRMLKSIKKTITIAVVVVMALLFVLVFLLLQSNNKQEELPRVEKISHEEIPQMQRKSIPVAVASKPPVYAAELELKDRIIIAKLPIDKNGLVPHPIMEDKSYAGNKLKELNKSLKTALEQYYRYEKETKNIEDGIQEEYLKTTQHFLDRKWGQTISQLFNDNVFVVKEKK